MTVLNVILGQHKKPKAAVHSAEMTGQLKKKKTSMPPVGFEPTTSKGERP
jgi:hypothetical protein